MNDPRINLSDIVTHPSYPGLHMRVIGLASRDGWPEAKALAVAGDSRAPKPIVIDHVGRFDLA